MRFGSETEEHPLDDGGSRVFITNNLRNKQVVSTRKRFEYRTRVSEGGKQELEEYLKFSEDMRENKATKLDPVFKIERNKSGEEAGYYYVVKCWTEYSK